eukprot:TRINITY_DN838_c0_g1_i8.p1 TRINITY_DN838_c0_g1~~TRINITY_DN838_c0_g1_i8.p1  ORF type:complete len:282 (+),score=58.96 TRINITY_DN838_c0_g1_i8:677-1522(+)
MLGSGFEVAVAEPLFDYCSEFALRSNAVKVENLPLSCTTSCLHRAFSKYGNVAKIRRYARCGVVYFGRIEEARRAYGGMGEFVDDSGVGHTVKMAKFLDEDNIDATEKMKAVTMFKLGNEQSLKLAQQLISENLVNEQLLSKATNILAKEQEEVAPAIDTPNLYGKHPSEAERLFHQSKIPKLDYTPADCEAFSIPETSIAIIAPKEHSGRYPIDENILRSIISEERWDQIRENYKRNATSTEFTPVSKEVFEQMSRREKAEYLKRRSQMTNSKKYPEFPS